MSNLTRGGRLVFVLVLCFMTTACIKNKVTKENFDKIKDGMTLSEVEKILGKGEKETGDGSNVAGQFGVAVMPAATTGGGGETYVWERSGKKITLYFRQEKVVNKQSAGF